MIAIFGFTASGPSEPSAAMAAARTVESGSFAFSVMSASCSSAALPALPSTRSAEAFISIVPVRICFRSGGDVCFDRRFVLADLLDDRLLGFRRFVFKLRDQRGADGLVLFVGERAGRLRIHEPAQRGGPRRDAHFGIAVTEKRNDHVDVRAR